MWPLEIERCRGDRISTCDLFVPEARSRFLPELIDLIWNRQIDPGKVLTWNCLEQAAEGYQAMDKREAIKVVLRA
ncbi:MAG TPA: hypothetical protein VNT27_07135 [Propionibacteriaceae bacterium]|jgi:threonine dehydrogenase-like Zn-dependent dehydrogenase|nr:hypothetical protein [Propionibacteriaceae bacterium]